MLVANLLLLATAALGAVVPYDNTQYDGTEYDGIQYDDAQFPPPPAVRHLTPLNGRIGLT